MLRLLVGLSVSEAVPLYGGINDLGYYFMDVHLGSPPQRFSAIVDTGSEGLAVTCTPCASCGKNHMDPFFNPRISSSFSQQCGSSHLRKSECVFEKRYLEGSVLKGRVYTDIVGVQDSGSSLRAIPFGCIETETKLFTNQKANGIMGLSPVPKTAFLYADTGIAAFSLCLSQNGGEAEFFSSFQRPNTTTVNLGYRDSHYVVEPTQIAIQAVNGTQTWSSENSTSLVTEWTGTQVLIDSGSTITYFKDSFYRVLETEILDSLISVKESLTRDKSGPALCWNHENSVNIRPFLPVISISLKSSGGDIHVPFANYTVTDTVKGDKWKTCLTVASNSGLGRTDLGASWLLGRNVTLSTKDGWMTIDETECPQHLLTSRAAVEPLPGQLEWDSDSWPLFAVLALMLTVAACLLVLVKRSVVAPARYSLAPIQEVDE